MKLISNLLAFTIVFSIQSFRIWECSANHNPHNFIQCLLLHSPKGVEYSISNLIYTPTNNSFTNILKFSIRNVGLATPTTPKHLLIATPSHIQIFKTKSIIMLLYLLFFKTRHMNIQLRHYKSLRIQKKNKKIKNLVGDKSRYV